MKGRFFKTPKLLIGKTSHSHVVFIDEEAGGGATSFDAGHYHEITIDETGVPLFSPGPDGHTHESLEGILVKQKKIKEDESIIISDVLTLYKAGLEIEGESIENGAQAEDFYCGRQWDTNTKAKLDSLKRACLTINLCERSLDELSGYQRQQRSDLHYVPVEGGDQVACDILNNVSKVILNNCFYDREEAKVFEDESITGRGFINLFVSFDKDLRGEPVVERFPWDQVICGPHEKDDLSDCEYVIKSKMFSKANAKRLWPKIADDIEKNFLNFLDGAWTHENSSYDKYLQGKVIMPYSISVGNYKSEMVDIAKKEFRLLECWRKIYIPRSVAVTRDGDIVEVLENWSSRDIDAIRTIPAPDGMPAFTVIEQVVPKMRITKIIGGKVAADENPADLPIDDFFIIPVYAKRRGGKFWGKIESVKDLQKEINHRHSQSVDIGNKAAGYHYYIDSTTFVDQKEEEKFLQYSSSPGMTFKVQQLERVPRQTEGVKFPAEIVNLMQSAEAQFRELMNIVVTPTGANESGAHFMQQQKLKLTGNEFLFDNLSFAKKKLGILLAHVIQRYYKPERLLRILQNQNTKDQVDINGQPLDSWSEEELLSFIENADLTSVDVLVTESAFSPSMRMAFSMYLSELVQAGLPIPPQSVIEFSDIPETEKQKLMQSIAEQQAAQSQTADAAGQSEIVKTIISKTGIIPPAVQEQLGISVPQAPVESNQGVQGNEALAGSY